MNEDEKEFLLLFLILYDCLIFMISMNTNGFMKENIAVLKSKNNIAVNSNHPFSNTFDGGMHDWFINHNILKIY